MSGAWPWMRLAGPTRRLAGEAMGRPRLHARSKKFRKPGVLRGIPLTPSLPRLLDPDDRQREWWARRPGGGTRAISY